MLEENKTNSLTGMDGQPEQVFESVPSSDSRLITTKIILGVSGICVAYWFFESFMHFWVTPHPTWKTALLGADLNELLKRLIVLWLFIMLGSHVQHAFKKLREAEEALESAKAEENKILALSGILSNELNLYRLLGKIVTSTEEILAADRCMIFLYDENSNQLHIPYEKENDNRSIRMSCDRGVCGTVFTSGEIINVRDHLAAEELNRDFDEKLGYQTRSILAAPVVNKAGFSMGVILALNKEDGTFNTVDERRLKAFSSQASMAIENATMFEKANELKNYNESILESMKTGIISLDAKRKIVKCNSAALRILEDKSQNLLGVPADYYFLEENEWINESIEKAMDTGEVDIRMDTDVILTSGDKVSVNISIVPLSNLKKEIIGTLLVIEDITQEKRLKATMARYMTKEVAEKLLEEGEAVLGGQTQVATILFSDIHQFTKITEKIGPKDTVAMLNEYFTIMVDIVFKYKGVLDKYIGDALLAVFGAPFSSGNDPDFAVKAAIDMQVALKELNHTRLALNKEPLVIRIGANTDEVLAGNIGSIKRMDFTFIGDGVNLAAHLEQVNKVYGSNVLISESTFKSLHDKYTYREIDKIRVKGKINPVSIYEILDYHDGSSFPHLNDVINSFKEGFHLYQKGDWEEGSKHFKQSLILNPSDAVSRHYYKRCRYFLLNPPSEDWDGVWDISSRNIKLLHSIQFP